MFVYFKKLEHSRFPPHKQLINYDPQIMRRTAQLDLVPSHFTKQDNL